MTTTKIWPSYQAMLDEANEKIFGPFLNEIGHDATRGNTEPPREYRVRELAADAMAFMIGVAAKQFPDRSQETAEILRPAFDDLVNRILSNQPTMH